MKMFRRKLNWTFLVVVLSALMCCAILSALVSDQNIANQIYYVFSPQESISCYRTEENSLQDISDEDVPKGRSIFFHETSCNSHRAGKIVITPRQACAVESAAKMNPNLNVYLLFASPGIIKFENTESDRMLQALMSYKNVKLLHVNFERYTTNTPLEEIYQRKKVDYSDYAQSHASDVLRYLTLSKYGGIYLDLDVIVIKSLEELSPNYAGRESEKNVAAGVLSFSPTGLGLHHAKKCLDDLKNNFKGEEWGYNGPGVITRLLKNICGVKEAKEMDGKYCQGFTVYPPEYFYPIPWWNWTMYFDENQTNIVNKLTKHSYVIHVWNKHSESQKVRVGSKAAYGLFANEFCPKVYNECDNYF